MIFLTLLLVAIGLLDCLSGTVAHVFRLGACPNIEVVEAFSFSKFQGRWYTIEKSQTASSCMWYNFTTNNDGSLQVREHYRLFGIKIFDWNDVSQVGKLTVPDSEFPAQMMVQFPFSLNPFSESPFWVISTDYEQYAAIWSCRPMMFGNFQSGMILSRNHTLDRAIVNKLRSRFGFFGVDTNDFTLIDQGECNDDDHSRRSWTVLPNGLATIGWETTAVKSHTEATISIKEPINSTQTFKPEDWVNENLA